MSTAKLCLTDPFVIKPGLYSVLESSNQMVLPARTSLGMLQRRLSDIVLVGIWYNHVVGPLLEIS